MTAEQPELVPPPEEIWVFDDTGKNLKFLSKEELENAIKASASTKPKVTTAELTPNIFPT